MSISISKIFDRIPKMSVPNGNPDTWNKIADWASRPAPNRAITGITAYITQPYIDGHNRNVDKATRDISKDRTRAKVIVGTLAGIAVRQPSYNLVEAMTHPEGTKKYSKWLIPGSKLLGLTENSIFLKTHRIIVSTLLALGIMCFSNFALDAPGTAFLTNLLIDRRKARNALKEGVDA